MGGTLPKYDRKGNRVGDVKVKISTGSKPGLINCHAIERIKARGMVDRVWKTEGVSDCLALFSVIPEKDRDRHVVLTNANGANENPKWMAPAMAVAEVIVLHDRDEPGQAGAQKWAKEISRNGSTAVIAQLPYEIEPNHGKDVRDFISEGNKYSDIEAKATSGQRHEPVREGEPEAPIDELPTQELILSQLGIEVLYESDNQSVRVFSHRVRKSTTIDRIGKLGKTDILQIAGPGAEHHISNDPNGNTTWSLEEIRDALALVASTRRSKHNDRGVGVWQGLNENGENNESVILANGSEAARWNGDRVLRRIEHPRIDGMVLDFGHGDANWFDYDTLARYAAHANESEEWRSETIDRAVSLFRGWRWRHETDPELVTGLVMATWVQTIWAWRPLVAVTGESGSGKTTLFEALGGRQERLGIFGGLALSGAKSSEAGVRQAIGNTGKIVLLDEFEKSKDRDAILQTLRASSRGDTVRKGTAGGQKGTAFRMQHIAWIAAIESGLHRQPDINRFVCLELLPAEEGKRGKLLAPSATEAVDLGMRLLATTLVCALDARNLAIDLKSTPVEGADSRQVETYAVPASILACSLGFDRQRSAGLLCDLLRPVVQSNANPIAKDHDELLDTILNSAVRCDRGTQYTVGQLLESYHASAVAYLDNQKDLERCGIAFREGRLVLNDRLIRRELLRDTDWRSQRVDQYLMRIDGAERGKRMLAGRSLRCIELPLPEAEGDQ